jgi:hypothetical protein
MPGVPRGCPLHSGRSRPACGPSAAHGRAGTGTADEGWRCSGMEAMAASSGDGCGPTRVTRASLATLRRRGGRVLNPATDVGVAGVVPRALPRSAHCRQGAGPRPSAPKTRDRRLLEQRHRATQGCYQGESWMLDSPEGVCPGQARFEYPATSVLFSKQEHPGPEKQRGEHLT